MVLGNMGFWRHQGQEECAVQGREDAGWGQRLRHKSPDLSEVSILCQLCQVKVRRLALWASWLTAASGPCLKPSV